MLFDIGTTCTKTQKNEDVLKSKIRALEKRFEECEDRIWELQGEIDDEKDTARLLESDIEKAKNELEEIEFGKRGSVPKNLEWLYPPTVFCDIYYPPELLWMNENINSKGIYQ